MNSRDTKPLMLSGGVKKIENNDAKLEQDKTAPPTRNTFQPTVPNKKSANNKKPN